MMYYNTIERGVESGVKMKKDYAYSETSEDSSIHMYNGNDKAYDNNSK